MQNNIKHNLESIITELPSSTTLIAVSKYKRETAVLEAYAAGQRDFGENHVQELVRKQAALPADIRWHMIGHLQRNKVKYIAPFIHLIHSVDSENLLKEINKEAVKNGRVINVLLQLYIATEDTKFGLSQKEALQILERQNDYPCVSICGFMGMASNTDDELKINTEFEELKLFFEKCKRDVPQIKPEFKTLSMGMTSDYKIALKHGATHIRVGSAIFGARNED